MANPMSARRVMLAFGDVMVPVELTTEPDRVVARVYGEEIGLTVQALSDGTYAVTSAGRRTIVHYASDGTAHHIQMGGNVYSFQRDRARAGRPGTVASHHQDLGAPMPGLITHIFVQEAQTVAAGDPLFVVEAMKMEHVVRAPASGRVARIRTAPGQQVEGGAIVVEVEEG
jgi:biotin carboxyl carrier protein